MLAPRLGANIGSSFAGDWNQERRRKPSRYFIECFRVYLKTPNAPGQRTFSRCAAPFFLEIRQYSCEKMSCSAQKFLAAGHIGSFQIHPKIAPAARTKPYPSVPFLPYLFRQDGKDRAAGGASGMTTTERAAASDVSFPLCSFLPFQTAN